MREERGERRRENAPAHVQRDDLRLLAAAAVHVGRARQSETQCGTGGMLRRRRVMIALASALLQPFIIC